MLLFLWLVIFYECIKDINLCLNIIIKSKCIILNFIGGILLAEDKINHPNQSWQVLLILNVTTIVCFKKFINISFFYISLRNLLIKFLYFEHIFMGLFGKILFEICLWLYCENYSWTFKMWDNFIAIVRDKIIKIYPFYLSVILL